MAGEGGIQEGLNAAPTDLQLSGASEDFGLADPNAGTQMDRPRADFVDREAADVAEGDPNASLGQNLWGVETLFGRRGVQRRYGEGAGAQAINPGTADTTPTTTLADPTGDGGGRVGIAGTGGSGGVHVTTGDGSGDDGDPNINTSNRLTADEILGRLSDWSGLLSNARHEIELRGMWDGVVNQLDLLLQDGLIGQAQYDSMMRQAENQFNNHLNTFTGTTNNAGNVLNGMLSTFDGLTKTGSVTDNLAVQRDALKAMLDIGEIGQSQYESMLAQLENRAAGDIQRINNPNGASTATNPFTQDQVREYLGALLDDWGINTPESIADASTKLEENIAIITKWLEDGNIGQNQFNSMMAQLASAHSSVVSELAGSVNPNTGDNSNTGDGDR